MLVVLDVVGVVVVDRCVLVVVVIGVVAEELMKDQLNICYQVFKSICSTHLSFIDYLSHPF